MLFSTSSAPSPPQEMNMSAVFSLYTLAGFPSLPCIGSVVRFGEKESERRAVITDITQTIQTSLITLDKREPMLVCVCVCLHLRTRVWFA